MNKQQLASKIWASANKMRSKIEANEYKDYILGFIFYKFLSDSEESFLKGKDWSEDDFPELKEEDEEVVKFCQRGLGYFISYEHLFSTWINKGADFQVANVRDAISAFNRLINDTHKKVFEKIFDTLQTGLSKLGNSAGSQTKAINDLLILIKDIPTHGNQDYDILGFIYEYLISNFAANAGKKAGEFYTPHEVALLMSEIVAHHSENKEKIEIYDPTSGSGSLLINIGQAVAKHINNKDNIKYYAQELKENTYNLTRMNLVMRGIKPFNIVVRNGDTLEDDWPYFDENDKERTYLPLYVDAVVSNPPYSQTWDSENKESDPRYSRFGLAPRGKADYAFLLHDLYHVKPDGIMTIVLPHGVLFRGGEEEKIRRNLIEENKIDTIIGLPSNIFFGTGIPTTILVLKQNRENTDVLFIDASKGFIKEGKNNKLRACDIKKIVDAIFERNDEIPKFARKVSREEIRATNYNLNIPRYIDSSSSDESWDIYATMFGGIPNIEIDGFANYWNVFTSLRSKLFKSDDTPYSTIVVDDVKSSILNNDDVKSFTEKYNDSFSDFEEFLKSELLDNMKTLSIQKEEHIISKDIFSRISQTSLVDKYYAYQLLDNEWVKIAIDLEIFQTEGFGAFRQVDPNMVTKKIKSIETEVQDGWVGHIIPFELVQKNLLTEDYESLKIKEEKLSVIPSNFEELLEQLTEDEKETEVLNDANNAFVVKEVTRKIKELRKEEQTADIKEFLLKLVKVEKLITEEKKLKSEIKKETLALINKTRETIESLSEDDIMMLLELKWIKPLYLSLAKIPDNIINNLTAKIKALTEKYAVSLVSLDGQIKESEESLSSLIDELEGNDYDMAGLREFQTLLKGE
ncbi:MAG: type I restriction-modification system subunit M [Bacteroidetes bacterium]|nr:type I restriction-modification system subunit M [Bacteroidota bacterium]